MSNRLTVLNLNINPYKFFSAYNILVESNQSIINQNFVFYSKWLTNRPRFILVSTVRNICLLKWDQKRAKRKWKKIQWAPDDSDVATKKALKTTKPPSEEKATVSGSLWALRVGSIVVSLTQWKINSDGDGWYGVVLLNFPQFQHEPNKLRLFHFFKHI